MSSSRHGVPAAKVSIILQRRAGRAATADRRVAHDPRAIVYVGQIIPAKGLDLLLDAAGLLVTRGRDVRVVVVGAMDAWVAPDYVGYRERLLRRAKAPDLAGRVDFLGWREDVPAILAARRRPLLPVAPGDARGASARVPGGQGGRASLRWSSRRGPFPEIIGHRVDGWICREASAEALAEGVEYFIADPARRERAGQAARASATRFSREQFAEAWWRAFTTPTHSVSDTGGRTPADMSSGGSAGGSRSRRRFGRGVDAAIRAGECGARGSERCVRRVASRPGRGRGRCALASTPQAAALRARRPARARDRVRNRGLHGLARRDAARSSAARDRRERLLAGGRPDGGGSRSISGRGQCHLSDRRSHGSAVGRRELRCGDLAARRSSTCPTRRSPCGS